MTIPSAYGWSPEGWRKRNPVQRSQRIQRGRSRVNPGNKSRMGNHNRALGAHPTHLPHRPGLSPHPCDIDKPLHRASPYTTSDIVPLIMITYRFTHLHIYHV